MYILPSLTPRKGYSLLAPTLMLHLLSKCALCGEKGSNWDEFQRTQDEEEEDGLVFLGTKKNKSPSLSKREGERDSIGKVLGQLKL